MSFPLLLPSVDTFSKCCPAIPLHVRSPGLILRASAGIVPVFFFSVLSFLQNWVTVGVQNENMSEDLRIIAALFSPNCA